MSAVTPLRQVTQVWTKAHLLICPQLHDGIFTMPPKRRKYCLSQLEAQHARLWKPYLKWVRGFGVWQTATRVYRRYLKYEGA